MSDQEFLINEINKSMGIGDFDQALHLIDSAADITPTLLLKKSIIYEKVGEYQKSYNLAEEISKSVEKESIEPCNISLRYRALVTMAYALWRFGDFKEARKFIDTTISDLDEIIKQIPPDTEVMRVLAEFHYVSGIIHNHMSEDQSSINAMERAYEIRKEFGTKSEISHSLNALGIAYEYTGDFHKAMEYYQKSLNIKREIGNPQDIGRSLLNLGYLEMNFGNYDKAEDHMKEALKLFEKSGSELDLGKALSSLGDVMQNKGNLEEASRYLQDALDFTRHTTSDYELIDSYSSLIGIFLDLNLMDEAERHLKEVESIIKDSDNLIVKDRLKLLKAKILKHHRRSSSQVEAMSMFVEVYNNPKVRRDLKVTATFNIIQLLIAELQRYSDNSEEILVEIQKYLSDVALFVSEEDSRLTEAQLNLLKARIALIKLDLETAQDCFRTARQLAVDNNLKYFLADLDEQYVDILHDTTKFRKVFTPLSIEERILYLEFGGLFSSILNQKQSVYNRVQEEPIVFVVAEEGGTPRYAMEFEKRIELNVQLVTSFISAINSFSSQLALGKGGLDLIKHDHFSILIDDSIDGLLMSYIFEGNALQAMRRMNLIVEALGKNSKLVDQLQDKGYIHPELTESMNALVSTIFEDSFNSILS